MDSIKLFPKTSALLLSLFALLLPACNTNQTDTTAPGAEDNVTQTDTTTPAEDGNVTTGEVAEDTSDLIGQTVTIRSNALEQIEPSVFTVSDQQFFGGENIIVVNDTGQPFTLPTTDDTEVQVTGEVQRFVLADIERDFDLDLNDDLYVEYEERPAIIAQSLAIAPEPGEITENPSQYYGETLAVTGEVAQVYGNNTFSLDDDELLGGNDLLVVETNPSGVVKEGATVAATGELRSFVVAELERDYDLTWDLDFQRQLEAEYTDKPVLVVDRVYESAIPESAK
ncbi:hypothetical protein IQ238_06295 [Pleurocapsales cyanobacterium LEGE 06147]|nr:hypothetical protein [Pleurocapsales cyanobacterium LEGE 06147]